MMSYLSTIMSHIVPKEWEARQKWNGALYLNRVPNLLECNSLFPPPQSLAMTDLPINLLWPKCGTHGRTKKSAAFLWHILVSTCSVPVPLTFWNRCGHFKIKLAAIVHRTHCYLLASQAAEGVINTGFSNPLLTKAIQHSTWVIRLKSTMAWNHLYLQQLR